MDMKMNNANIVYAFLCCLHPNLYNISFDRFCHPFVNNVHKLLCLIRHRIQAWETTSWCSLAGDRAYMVTVHGRGEKYLASVASVVFLLLAYVLRRLLVLVTDYHITVESEKWILSHLLDLMFGCHGVAQSIGC